MKRAVRLLGFAALIVLGLVWIAGELLLPANEPAPGATAWAVSPESEAVLRRACYDCHSDEVRWPWYSHVPVISLLLAIDTRKGKEELNFSRWSELSPDQRKEIWEKSLEEIREGEMPPGLYLLLHADGRLSEQDRTLLETLAP